MLKNYQQSFYDMVVNKQAEALVQYTGSHLPWQTGVYQNNYQQGLKASLNKKYKRVSALLGKDADSLFNVFIDNHPSTKQNLASYGETFPAWLEQCGDNGLPNFIVDVAELDKLLYECYYAENADSIDLAAYGQLSDAEQLSYLFVNKSSVLTLKSSWDLKTILENPSLDLNEEALLYSKSDNERYYAIFREEGIPKWSEIHFTMYKLLSLLNVPKSLWDLENNVKQGHNLMMNSTIDIEKDMPLLLLKGWLTHGE